MLFEERGGGKSHEELPLFFIPSLFYYGNAFNFMCLVCICIEEVFETRELPVVAFEDGPEFCFCFDFVLFLFCFEEGSKELCFCFKSFVFLSYFHTSIFGKLCFAKSRIKTLSFHVHFY